MTQYAKDHKLSGKQYEILCNIQKATYDEDFEFLNCLPNDIVKTAIDAQKFWSLRNDKDGNDKDTELCELVKKYWDKNGISINQ